MPFRSGMIGIRVVASVDRENAIFLTGETINLLVSLRNVVKAPNSLAWGCVQLHCDQILSKTVVDDRTARGRADSTTSLSTGKTAIFSSKPVIIFCDIRLSPNDTLEYPASFDIPSNLPPSFKGSFVKYNWFITVAVQHVDAPVKMLHLPLRILNLAIPIELPSYCTGNPFLTTNAKQPPVLDFARSAIEESTSIRLHQYFKINDGTSSAFATVALFKNAYKLGDDIVCRLSFADDSDVQCSMVTVRLESVEEEVHGGDTLHAAHNVTMHSVQYIVTMFMEECHCVLAVPGSAVPTFSTDVVRLKWRLHFDFLVSAKHDISAKSGCNELAKKLNCEKIFWDHYIDVHACNPFNVNLACTQSQMFISENV